MSGESSATLFCEAEMEDERNPKNVQVGHG